MSSGTEESATTLPPGVSVGRLARYLADALDDERWMDLQVELIAGGKSNLTYLIRADGLEAILRRPPLDHVLPTAHDMAREARVVRALEETSIPVPRVLHLCLDEAVLGCVFYVSEWCVGHKITKHWPPLYAESPAEKRKVGEAVIDTLVALHSIDPAAIGLDEFGRSEGYMERQLRRWRKQWRASETGPLPPLKELADRLTRAVPRSADAALVHGDYRLDNLLLDRQVPGRIRAVLDWEMSTLGDPLADLGLALVYWPQINDDRERIEALPDVHGTVVEGYPTRRDAAERYAVASKRDVSGIAFYYAFGFFKLAVILEGIHARYLMGGTAGEGFEVVGEKVPVLVELGLQALGRSGPDDL